MKIQFDEKGDFCKLWCATVTKLKVQVPGVKKKSSSGNVQGSTCGSYKNFEQLLVKLHPYFVICLQLMANGKNMPFSRSK